MRIFSNIREEQQKSSHSKPINEAKKRKKVYYEAEVEEEDGAPANVSGNVADTHYGFLRKGGRKRKRFDTLRRKNPNENFNEAAPPIKFAKIIRGLRDSQGPFTVVAMKRGKVVGQKASIKTKSILPAA